MKPWPETHVAVGFDLAWQHRRAAEDRQDQQWSKSTPTYLCFQYFMDQHWITKTCHHKTADFLFLIDICWTGITQNSYVLLNLWKHIYTNWIPPPPTSALSHKTLKRQWWEVMFALALKCCNELYDQYFTAGWTLHHSVLFTAAASPAKQSSSDRRVEQNAECLNQRGSDAMTL